MLKLTQIFLWTQICFFVISVGTWKCLAMNANMLCFVNSGSPHAKIDKLELET